LLFPKQQPKSSFPMKFLFVLALAICGVSFSAQAQNGTPGVVKGSVTDSANTAPLGFVTVSLREAGKTEALKSTYSKENGAFEFSGLAIKTYELIISYVGYQTRTIKVNALSTGNAVADLQKIKLQANAKQLKEVEVTAQKILVTQDIDKISYDVEADPESKTNTALDMLRKVPMVTVDADDNIQLKGSGSYRILVNGKASALFVRNPKDVLKTMPAATIKKIEVITNPPAKYEAEGVGGIINIITTKKTPAGYNGSVSASARYPKGYNGNAYLTVKTGKLGFSGSYGANAWFPPTSQTELTRNDLKGNTNLVQDGESNNHGRNHYSNAELSYELDSLNLFTANFSFYKGSNDVNLFQKVTLDSAGRLLQKYTRQNVTDENWTGRDLGLDYQRSFRKNEEQLLTLSYKYNISQENNFVNFDYIPELNFIAQQSKTNNESSGREHTFQADYVQPFKEHTFEVGLKSITRLNQSDYFYALLNPASGQFEVDPLQTDDFDYRQDIYAGYTSVSLKHKDWGLKLGTRLEETRIDASFKTAEEPVTQDYFNLIPSVALSRKLKESQDLKFSYTQRLERPGLWYLNPYVDRTDPKNISFGNPELKAATSHSFDLSHSTFIKTSSINSSLYYTFTNNAIQQFSTTTGTGKDAVVETTYGNLGREKNAGLSVNANLNPTPKLNLNINSSLNYTFITGFVNGHEAENNGFSLSLFGYGSYKFEKNWRLSANVGYNSRMVLLQGRTGGYFHNSLTLAKTFLKNDKATINLSVTSPFQKQRTWKNEISDQDFHQVQESVYWMRRVSVAFTYKFGQLKGGIASKKRGIENSDVKGGKSGGGN
jgi:outer membrane receptor protein involved in Fe transport